MFKLFFVLFSFLMFFSNEVKAESENVLFVHGDNRQGEMLFGYTNPGAVVKINDKDVFVRDDGWFVFGIGRDEKSDIVINSKINDKEITKTLKVKKRKWKIQKIDGLPENKVNPPQEIQDRIMKENEYTYNARQKPVDMQTALCYQMPAKGRLSSVYGSQRILNGNPKNAHNAIDIAIPQGTPVLASADGYVIVAYDEMYISGKTIVIAHGGQVTTSYLHLSKIDVKEGDFVKRGQKIGEVGSTGRSTGPHLHWAVLWKNVRVDPVVFVQNSKGFCN
ncbi:MAG: M23 family metallopeptidase [Alphaproteobacteria bacterium]|nr:M23 family metallopeptidase [Alphaproteobacteria bacterium]